MFAEKCSSKAFWNFLILHFICLEVGRCMFVHEHWAESWSNGFCSGGAQPRITDTPQDPWQPWQGTSEGFYGLYQLLKLITVMQLAVCLTLSVCWCSALMPLSLKVFVCTFCVMVTSSLLSVFLLLHVCVYLTCLPFPSHLVVPIAFFFSHTIFKNSIKLNIYRKNRNLTWQCRKL